MRRILVLILVLSTLLTATAPAAHADDPVQRCDRLAAHAATRRRQLRRRRSVTADVVYVLALAGEDPGGPAWTKGGKSALAALADADAGLYRVRRDAGQAGKVARAVAAAGRDPRNFAGMDVISVIEQAYDPTTGRYHPTQLFHHTLAVEALLRAGEPVPTAAMNALLAAQLPNGGWFWAFIDPGQIDPSKDQSDVDATGRVLQLLAGQLDLQCLTAYLRARRDLSRGRAVSQRRVGWAGRAGARERQLDRPGGRRAASRRTRS